MEALALRKKDLFKIKIIDESGRVVTRIKGPANKVSKDMEAFLKKYE